MDESLKHDLFLLLGFLLTSAHGLYDEPASYGPFRLVDAAGRLLELMQAQNLSDPFLQQLGEELARERFAAMSDPPLRQILDEWVMRYTEELKERAI
jgi:hypothetical protein